MRPLVLFDIDATLLKTDGAGMAAMADAGRELFGPGFSADGIDFAGRLDPLLFRELMGVNGVSWTAAAESRMREVYRGHLQRRLASATNARALPGALDLVQAVREARTHEMGVLTGNFQETGSLKLGACGLDPKWFTVCAWGDDSPHEPPARDHLPPVAMRRYRELLGVEVDPAEVTIVGDTPHDVRCARVNGCRCVGVATGKYSMDELATAGAGWVVADLTDTERMLDLLGVASGLRPT
jgi:phosphoglycolate phosphatase